MSLYEKETIALDSAINNFIDENPDIELTPDIVSEIMQGVSSNIKDNLTNICRYVKRLESDIELCASETQRISKLKKAYSTKIEGLKGYVLPYILEKGKQDLGLFKVSNRKNSKVIIMDEDLIGAEFKEEKTIVSIDKRKLKEFLTSNTSKGAEIQQTNSIQIK